MRTRRWLDALTYDVKFAVRGFGRQRAWTAVALATLALGLGANVAVFSVVNAMLLNPLPYRDADRLVRVWRHSASAGMSVTPTPPMVGAWRDRVDALDGIEGYTLGEATLTGNGDPAVLRTASITPGFLDFAGTGVILGRAFQAGDAALGAAPVVVLLERTWRTRFGADPAVVGRALVLDGVAHTVVGIAADRLRFPANFQDQAPRDLLRPLDTADRELGVSALARIRAGATIQAAQDEMNAVASADGLREAIAGATFTTWLVPPGDTLGMRQSLVVLSAAVAFILLIACVNVAHLLIVRGAEREREMAIRTAIGAGPWRLAAQLSTESALLTVAGGALGLLVGAWLLRVLVALRPDRVAVLDQATLDATVFRAAALAVAATGALFALISVWRAIRDGAAASLRSTSTTATADRRKQRVQGVLVVTEVAVSAVLLVGATLLVRTVGHLQKIDPGFDTRGLYSVEIPLPPATCAAFSTTASVVVCRAFAERWLERVRTVPGVRTATLAAAVPPQNSGYAFEPWETRDGPTKPDGSPLTAVNHVRPEYFDLLGLPIDAGRGFDAGSADRGEVVVNRTLAHQLWPGQSPIGRQLRLPQHGGGGDHPWLTVAGVVPDSAVDGLRTGSPDDIGAAVYYASKSGGYVLAIRADDRAALGPAVRAISIDLDPAQAPPTVTRVADALDMVSIAPRRFSMRLLATFAGVAVLLASVGLYGVISQMVAQRTREIGIRVVLGGSRAHIAGLVLRRALALAAAGVGMGLVGARLSTSFVQSMLFGVEAADPASYVAGGLALLGMAIVACLAPLWRALRVEPAVATRSL